MLPSIQLLEHTDFPAIKRDRLTTLQVNLGYLCNQSCVHCHVNAGPGRTELMQLDTIELLLEVIEKRAVSTLDVTGGAPEMNPHFRYLIEQASRKNVEIIDRCNLSILLEPGYEDLAEFLASHKVVVTASLPCYSEANVDAQRGPGVFEKSIDALQKLNALGYGRGKGLKLDLVYNPVGASLPPDQQKLQAEYSERLYTDFGIVFDELYTITNMPISRFGSLLQSKGQFQTYLNLLRGNYSESNLDTVMCRSLVSVDWLGNLYDCDFNQMLELGMIAACTNNRAKPQSSGGAHHSDSLRHLRDLLNDDTVGQSIVVGEHCYGCTAGQGSSCGGALN